MNLTYQSYLTSDGKMEDVESFKAYLLTQDTIIIPTEGKLICAPWVTKKIHEDPNSIKDKLFYKDGDTIYFIYSKNFMYIGEVKVLFDTTSYITSQLIIIKTGLIFIFLVFILQFFAGKFISHRLLKDLKSISEKLKNVDINSRNKYIICKNMPEDDEIRILAEALNSSYDTIDTQTGKLKQFITDVSHEFKTPLMAMSSEIDVLEKRIEKKSLDTQDVEVFFTHARGNIRKLNTLLETLFFLSRIEEQKQCLVKKPISLQTYIEKKIQNFSHSFSNKDIQVQYNIPKNFTLDVEENTFSILLDNLLSNAIKFSGTKVKLTISVEENTLKIEDAGAGIEKKDLEKIWDKFYRKDYNKEGFGVGLFLVKRIIEIYDWEISVESKIKKGTIFSILFK